MSATDQPRPTTPTSERVFVYACGKHPAWPDFLEGAGDTQGIGDATAALVAFRQAFHHPGGIYAIVDGGGWMAGDKLDARAILEDFDHVVVWRRGESLVIARVWGSSDSVVPPRRYPFILAAELRGLSLGWALQQALPLLEASRPVLRAAADRTRVNGELGALRDLLRTRAEAPGAGAPLPALSTLADRPELGPDGQGLLRLLYEVERDMADLKAAGKASGFRKRGPGEFRPRAVRAPALKGMPAGGAALWLALAVDRLGAGVPVLLATPVGRDWIDLIAGDFAQAGMLRCLRLVPGDARGCINPASQVPYDLDAPALRKIVASWSTPPVQARLAAALDGPVRPGGAAFADAAGDSPLPRVALIVGVVALVLGLLLLMLVLAARGSGVVKPGGAGAAPSSDLRPGASAPSDPASAPAPELQASSTIESPADRLDAMRFQWANDLARRVDEYEKALKSDAHAAAVMSWFRGELAAGLNLDPAQMPGGEDLVGVRRALAALTRVRDDLSPARWPALRAVASSASAFESRGWSGAAGLLRQAAADAAPGGRGDWLARLSHVIELAASAGAINAAMKSAEADMAVIARFKDPLLDAFASQAALKPLAGESPQRQFQRLVEDSAAVAAEASALSQLLTKEGARIDWAAAPREVVKVGPGPATLEACALWRQAILDYRRAPGEHPALESALAPARFDQAAKGLKELASLDAAASGRLGETLAGVRRAVETLRARAWIVRDQASIAAAASAATRDLAALNAQVALALSAATTDRKAWLQSVLAHNRITELDVVNAAYAKARDRALGGVDAERLQSDGALYAQKRARVDQLRQAASAWAIDTRLTTARRAEGALGEQEWFAALERAAAARWGEVVAAKLGDAPGLERAADAAGVSPARDEAAREFDAWREAISTLALEAAAVQRTLAPTFLGSLDDVVHVGAGEGRSVAQVASGWDRAAAMKSPLVREALSPIVAQVDALRALSALDRPALTKLAGARGSTQGAAALALWRRLGQAGWPANVEELALEARLRESLTALIAQTDGPRQESLRRELSAQGPTRWQRAFASAQSPAQEEAAAALMAPMGVEPASLPPAVAGRLLAAELSRELKAKAEEYRRDDASLRRRVGVFVDAAGKLGGPAADRAGRVSGALSIDARGGDPAQAGPASPNAQRRGAAFSAVARMAGEALIFTGRVGDQPFVLAFRRVRPEGQPPAFVATAEMSVGLLVAVASQSGSAVVERLPRRPGNSSPNAWAWADDRKTAIHLSPRWVEIEAEPNLGVIARMPPPDASGPAQKVTLEAARAVAEALGCRLPTLAEHRAALALAGASSASSSTSSALASAQLRGAMWRKQLEARQSNSSIPDPVTGAFLPAGKAADAIAAIGGNVGGSTLYFRRVDAASMEFQDLIGNVAEMVDAGPGGKGPAMVVGASSLWPVRWADGSAVDPRAAWELASAEGARTFWADVGFRLAFDEPGEPLVERVLAALEPGR